MRPVVSMVAVSLSSWIVVSILVDKRTSLEILAGLLGPLIAVSVTWILADKVYRQHPAALTRLMMAAFAGKLIFFGIYVAVMLGLLSLRPIPFIASFTSYFIGLYLTEALYLRRLFLGGMRASR